MIQFTDDSIDISIDSKPAQDNACPSVRSGLNWPILFALVKLCTPQQDLEATTVVSVVEKIARK